MILTISPFLVSEILKLYTGPSGKIQASSSVANVSKMSHS